MIKFAQIHWSYAYLFLTGLILLFFWGLKKTRRLEEKFAQKDLLPALVVSLNMKKRNIKALLLLFFFVFSIFSLMRPQWGFYWRQTRRQGVNFLIALDLSKSMLSEDVKPSRLERSKLAIGDLIKELAGDRIGLIIFTSKAFLQCPLTADYSGFLITLKAVGVNLMPRGGTAIASAVKDAIEVFKHASGKDKILIIITDGENFLGDPVKVAEEAKKAGIVIYCIGVGSKDGDLIPVIDQSGKKAFLKDREGNVVKSRMNEELLKSIAITTGGSYIHATPTDFGLLRVYNEKVKKAQKTEFKNKKIKIYEDHFQIFLGIALICLILEFFIDERKR